MADTTEQTESGTADALNPLQLFVDYPFHLDATYQQGLASVLAGAAKKTEEEKEDILRRSRVFYFNRVTGFSVTVENTLDYEQSVSAGELTKVSSERPLSSQSPSLNEVREIHSLSFAELKILIEQGKTDQIPNNKFIPEALNDAPPSESATQVRKKPWETP